jgi:hypothetical protein
MKTKTIITGLLVLGLLASFNSPLSADTGNGASANWKVTVVSAASYARARINPNFPSQYLEPNAYAQGKFNLILNLRFEYIGPPAEVPAPHIAVTDNRGNTAHAIGNLQTSSNDIGALSWLISLANAEPKKRSLKGGEKFGADEPITVYVAGMPEGATGLRLVFADVTPIPITPYGVLEEAVFKRILDEHLTEAEVTALLGPGKPSDRPGVPANMKELIWQEGAISMMIQFLGGKANGGKSTNLP